MSATLWTHDEGVDETVTPCRRSVGLGTDLSMADIENLQKEITELRKEMALRDAKLRQIAVEEFKKEGSGNATSPSLPCKSQHNSIRITWQHSNPGEDQHHGNPDEDQHMLPKVKEEPGIETVPILITWHHGNPGEDQHHGNPVEDHHMLPKVKEEPGCGAVCKTELNCPQMHFESHLCQPKLENVAIVHKNEPDPVEITLSVHDGGLQHALHCYSNQILTESLGSECDGRDQHVLLTPLKMCSVRLVDCSKLLKLNGNVAWGNPEGEQRQPASDASVIPAVQASKNRSAKPRHHVKELSLANTRNSKRKKLPLCSSSYAKQLVHSSGYRPGRKAQVAEWSRWCSHCQKSFTTDFNLHRHLKLHAGEKPYQCGHCGKRFAQLFNLTAHQRVHTGEKPYRCSVCRKQFSQASKLKTHKRIHTGEKPYICHACGKGFSDSSTYNKHQRIHTGERPYACSVCGKCFGQSAHLLKHNISHNRKPYNCSTCGKNFSKRSSLIKHTALHSGDSSTN